MTRVLHQGAFCRHRLRGPIKPFFFLATVFVVDRLGQKPQLNQLAQPLIECRFFDLDPAVLIEAE